jgi:hypothetical protein
MEHKSEDREFHYLVLELKTLLSLLIDVSEPALLAAALTKVSDMEAKYNALLDAISSISEELELEPEDELNEELELEEEE